MQRRSVAKYLFLPAVMAATLISPSPVAAQAWLPPKGDGSVSFAVQTIFFDGHFDNVGHKLGAGKSRASSLLLGLSYSFTDRFTAELALPYVITKYTGNPADLTFGHAAFVPAVLDNGSSHSSFQDFRLDLHYNVLKNSTR